VALTRTRYRAGLALTEDSRITGDPTNGTPPYAFDPLARPASFPFAVDGQFSPRRSGSANRPDQLLDARHLKGLHGPLESARVGHITHTSYAVRCREAVAGVVSLAVNGG
jgi:hypothetical protein